MTARTCAPSWLPVSDTRRGARPSGEGLGLQRVKLRPGDGTGREQLVRLRDLGRGVVARARDLADVVLLGRVLLCRPGHRTLSHALPVGDEVDEQREERQEEQEQQPQGLVQAAGLLVAEQVSDDPEKDHEVEEDEVEDELAPEEVAEIHAVLLRGSFPSGWATPSRTYVSGRPDAL